MPGKKRAAPTPNPTIVEEDAFPRGGGTGLAPIDQRKLREEAYAEAEADLFASSSKAERSASAKKKRKTKGRSEDEGDEEDIFFNSMSTQGKVPKFAELLKFKNLRVGSKLWGAIIEITPQELVVSLPHGLRGRVAYAEASDVLADSVKALEKAQKQSHNNSSTTPSTKSPSSSGLPALPHLTSIFSLGQLVRCTVVGKSDDPASATAGGDQNDGDATKTPNSSSKKKGNKRIDVSLRLSKFCAGLGLDTVKVGAQLPACVKSIEDHGFVLTFGIKGTSGFLPKKEAGSGSLMPGALVEVVVKESKAGGHAMVSTAHEEVAGAVTTEFEGLNIGTLLPGALVTARIRNILSDGLLVSFLTFFNGTIDPFHLATRAAGDWKKQYSVGQRMKARILYVDPESKQVGLTLLKHLVDSHAPQNFPMMGQVFEESRVVRVDPGLGLLLSLPVLPGSPSLTPGYAHLSNLDDKKVEDLETRFRIGQAVKSRVIGFRPMDGLAVMSLKPSVLEYTILSVEDLAPGAAVQGTVVKSSEEGLVVQLAPNLKVFVPPLHISDLASLKTHKKFKAGKKVSGRILTVDRTAKKATLTLKPSLVESKLPPLTDISEAVPGARSHGTITGVQDYGLFVSFYGKVKGLANVAECGLAEGQKLTDAFTAGQVVKCRVLGADTRHRGNLRLSLVTKKKSSEDAAVAAANASFSSIPVGAMVDGTVTVIHKKEDGETVAWYELECTTLSSDPNTTANKEKSKKKKGVVSESSAPAVVVVKGRLEVAHLADHPSAVAALTETLTVGSKLDGLLVLQRLDAASQLRVTRKAAIIAAAAAGNLPATLGEVSEGLIAPGYVASVTNDALFVRFLDCLTGRAGLAQLADTFVADPHSLFTIGQSVRAQVVQVSQEKSRFSLTLKQSLCGSSDAGLLASLFKDKDSCHALSEEDDGVDWDSSFPIGSLVKGEVHDVKEYGTLCDLEAHPDVVGLAAPHQCPPSPSQAAARSATKQKQKESPEGLKSGTLVTGVVLDVNKKDGIVDLSLLPRLVERAETCTAAGDAVPSSTTKRKTRKATNDAAAAAAAEAHGVAASNASTLVKIGDEVTCTIELVKADEGYCVVSLPAQYNPPIAFLSTCDYNAMPGTTSASPVASTSFQPGESVQVRVAAVVMGEENGGKNTRVLLQVLQSPLAAGAASGKGKQEQGTTDPKAASTSSKASKTPVPGSGSLVQGTISGVHAMHVDVQLESGHRGRVYITEAVDAEDGNITESPFKSLSSGQSIQCIVLGKVQAGAGKTHGVLELSTRPSLLSSKQIEEDQKETTSKTAVAAGPSWTSLKEGQSLQGFVQEVSGDHIWVAITPIIRGRIFIPQASWSSWKECSTASKAFPPGKPVAVTVLSIDAGKHALDLTLTSNSNKNNNTKKGNASASQQASFKPKTTAIGLIVSCSGSGVHVKLSPYVSGRVSLCDIHDAPVTNALRGMSAGQYVQVAVLGDLNSSTSINASGKKGGPKGGARQLQLSLKPSDGGQCAAHATAKKEQDTDKESKENDVSPLPASTTASSLKLGQKVMGYVRSAGPNGVFIALTSTLDARIRLRQLSVDFVEEPAKKYPEGMRVVGSVLSIEAGRVDLTLRQGQSKISLEALKEGQVVKGRVKRIERFGVFVELDSGVSGLAHLSELADDFVRDINGLFTVGQPVAARVLKVEMDTNRLSLGLKPSYFADLDDDVADGGKKEGEDSDEESDDFDADLEDAMAAASESGEGDSEEEDEEDAHRMDWEAGQKEAGEDLDLDEELAAVEDENDEEESESEYESA